MLEISSIGGIAFTLAVIFKYMNKNGLAYKVFEWIVVICAGLITLYVGRLVFGI